MRVPDVGLNSAPKLYPAAQLFPFKLTKPSTFCGFRPSALQKAGVMSSWAHWIWPI